MININLRASKTAAEELEKLYGSRAAGGAKAVEAFLSIRKYTIDSLKGYFTRNELTGLTAIQNGIALEPRYQANPRMFIAHIEDGEKFEAMSRRYEFDWMSFIEKVRRLNPAQVYFLQEEIDRYWNDNSRDLVKFLDEYC